MTEGVRKVVERTYMLGGMNNTDSGKEVSWVLSQIDGVIRAEVEKSNVLKVAFDGNQVTEDHLKGTLNSMGHGILNDGQ